MGRAKIIFVFLLFITLNAEEIQISADNFFADENKLFSRLDGNVIIKKGDQNTLKSKQAKIYFSKDKKVSKFEAIGNANFEVFVRTKQYLGGANLISYEPAKKLYILSGNAYLQEANNDKKIYGDKITINEIDGTYNVSGDKKPVKMIFQIGDEYDKNQ